MESLETASTVPSWKDLFLRKFRSSYELGEYEEIQRASREELKKLRKKYESARLQMQNERFSELMSDLLDEVKNREVDLPIAPPKRKQPEWKRTKKPRQTTEVSVIDPLKKIESKIDSVIFEGMPEMNGEYFLANPNYILRYFWSIWNRKYNGVFAFDKNTIDTVWGEYSFIDGSIKFVVFRNGQWRLTIRHTESPRITADRKVDEYLSERGYIKIGNTYKKDSIEITITENTQIQSKGIRRRTDSWAEDVRAIARILYEYKV